MPENDPKRIDGPSIMIRVMKHKETEVGRSIDGHIVQMSTKWIQDAQERRKCTGL